MNRTKPTENIVALGSLNLEPLKAVGFYIESIHENDHFIKRPNYECPGADTVELLACQNDLEHKIMLDLQNNMVEQSYVQEQINNMRVHTLYMRLTQLRNNFIDVNAFIKGCDEKKQQAKQTVMREQVVHQQLRIANVKCMQDIDVLKDFKTKLLGVVKELEPYETVIEEVVAKNKHRFSSVKDCMDRCDAIMLAYVEIEKMKREQLELIQMRQKVLIKMSREAALKVLKYMNELSALKRDYERESWECLKWEKVLVSTKDLIVQNELMRKRMTQGIKSMYIQLCRRRGIVVDSKLSQVVKQLDFIRDEIQILQRVFTLCQSGKSIS